MAFMTRFLSLHLRAAEHIDVGTVGNTITGSLVEEIGGGGA